MRIVYRLVGLFLFLFMVSGGWAQTLTPGALEVELAHPGSEIEQNMSLQIVLPLYSSSENRLMMMPRYRYLQLSDAFPFEVSQFHKVDFRFSWMHSLNGKWSSVFFFEPTLSSDFKQVSFSDLMWSSGIRMVYHKNERRTFYLGFIYANRYNSHLIIPAFGARRQLTDKIVISGNLPFFTRFSYWLNPDTETGVYYLRRGFSSGITGNPNDDYIWVHERSLGLFANRKVFRNWWMAVNLGYRINREVNAYREPEHASWYFGTLLTNNSLAPEYQYSESGFIMRLAISYRFSVSSSSP